MRKAPVILSLLAIPLLASCSPPPKSETYLRSVFDKLNIALTYEKICENSKHIETMNSNLTGNMQMVVAVYTGELMHNNPKATEADLAMMVSERKELVEKKMTDLLGVENGCQSIAAKDAQKFLEAFLEMSPPAFYSLISKNLESLGSAVHTESPPTDPVSATSSAPSSAAPATLPEKH